jgi:hypothetical protein
MNDPAVLFFIANWLTSTKEMKADCRGWYLNLILHQYDKKSLPNDVEELANLADVRVSEYDKFKEVWKNNLKCKFKINEEGRLENDFAKEIIRGRNQFLDKRSEAGKKSYFYKIIKSYTRDKQLIGYLIENINWEEIDLKNEQMFKQVFEHLFKLYINKDKDINKDNIKIDIDKKEEKPDLNLLIKTNRPLYLIEFIKEKCPNICKLKTQLTEEESKKIHDSYSVDSVNKVIAAMENKMDLSKKYKSVYLTCINWLSRETK